MLTVPEAANRARCCTKTIYGEVRQYDATKHLKRHRGLPAVKKAGKWLIKESDFNKWMETT